MSDTYFATKFDSAAAEVVSILSSVSEGYGREEMGDVDAPTGYFAVVHLLDGEEEGPGACDLDLQDTTGAYPVGDYAGEVARQYGVTADDVRGSWIVTTNGQGFVDVTRHDSREEAEAAYSALAEAFEAWSQEPFED